MRNIDKLLLLPLFATLALSCSSPTSLQTSEYDDVYYSKKDKTVSAGPNLAPEQEPEQIARTSDNGAVANPEYSREQNSGGQSVASTDYYSPDYYDEDDYYYASRIRRFNAPYRGFSYYDFAYTDYYWYDRNPRFYGRSIYYDPFYAYNNPYFYPCYTCYGYPGVYGSINIVIGRPYYSRWGWGDPYYGAYNRGYYGGYGGYGGYGRNYANSGWYRNDNYSRNTQYGPRLDRSNVPSGDKDSKAPNRPRRDLSSGGNNSGGGLVAPGDNTQRPIRSTRGREDMSNSGDNTGGTSQPNEPRTGTRGRLDRSSEPQPGTEIVPSDNLPANSPRRSTRGRAGQPETTPNPANERVIQPRNNNEYPDRPTRDRRTYEPQPAEQPVNQPRREERSEPRYQPQPRQEQQQRSEPRYQPQPRQEQRSEPRYQPRQEPTYQAPQRQERSYSPPSSTPSYNPPSRSSGGGGSSDGGGSRSTRGRGN